MEGKGDKAAVPVLARRVLSAIGGTDALFVDNGEPFKVKGIGTLVKNSYADWHRWLGAAGRTRKNIGAVLLVLDGDADQVPQKWASYAATYKTTDFCAYRVAAMLAHEARSSRAGDAFSLSVVFAMKEFEAWLVAGVESLRGEMLAEGRGTVPADATPPGIDIDIEAKRDAKGVLSELIPGYVQSLDQAVLAEKVDLTMVAQRCKSFRRFQSTIEKMVNAARSGSRIISPTI